MLELKISKRGRGLLVACELGEVGTGPCSLDFWNLARRPSSRRGSRHCPSSLPMTVTWYLEPPASPAMVSSETI